MSDTLPLSDIGPEIAPDIAPDIASPKITGVPIRGDLTQGPIFKTLLLFSIPMLVGNIIQTLNGSINAIWVGRLIGESALAATTNANGIMFLLFAGVFGLGMATTVRVGQHFGARNVDAARRTFGSGLGFTLAFAVTVGAIGWLVAPGLLHLLATPHDSQAEALAYLRVVFVTMPLGALSMTLGMGMRGVGETRAPLYATVLTVALDIVFNPLLIRGYGPIPKLGIAGSALSSGLANLAGVMLQIGALYAKDLPLALRGAQLRYLLPLRAELSYILAKGLPMSGQMLLIASAQMVMIGLVNREGTDTVAAYGASMQLWNYLQMPAFAISSAVSAMVAQNIGAGNHQRVNDVTRAGMIGNVSMTGVFAALLVLGARPLSSLFLGSASPALPISSHIQYICTWSYVIMGASMIMGGTMRAYGVVIAPLIIQVVALYPVRLGFYFMLHPALGTNALWWSFPVATCISTTMTALYFWRGPWRAKRDKAYG